MSCDFLIRFGITGHRSGVEGLLLRTTTYASYDSSTASVTTSIQEYIFENGTVPSFGVVGSLQPVLGGVRIQG